MLEFIFGGIFRLLPEIARLWEKDRERSHERAMLDLQFELDKKRAELELNKMEVAAELQQQIGELQAVIAATKAQGISLTKTGNPKLDKWLVYVEALSVSVRPIVTYWFCIAGYGIYKSAVFVALMSDGGISWDTAVQELWTDFDQQVVKSILGFWFVDRALRHQNSQ